MSSLIVIMMTSPKAYDVLVSSMWGAKWIVFCWAKTILFQNFQNSLIWVRKMSKRKTEKEKKIWLYRGIEWETKRQMGQQGKTERGRGRGWQLWEQRGLLPTRYSVVHVWVSSKVYLICSYQAELCNSKADRGWSFGYHPHKGMLFSFLGKNGKSLICFCFVKLINILLLGITCLICDFGI